MKKIAIVLFFIQSVCLVLVAKAYNLGREHGNTEGQIQGCAAVQEKLEQCNLENYKIIKKYNDLIGGNLDLSSTNIKEHSDQCKIKRKKGI